MFVYENYILFKDQELVHAYNIRNNDTKYRLTPQTTKIMVYKSVTT